MTIHQVDPVSVTQITGSVSIVNPINFNNALDAVTDNLDTSYLDVSDIATFTARLASFTLGSRFLKQVRYVVRAEWPNNDRVEFTLSPGNLGVTPDSYAEVRINASSPTDHPTGWVKPILSAADLTDLHVRMVMTSAMDVHELHVEYETVDQPVTAIDAYVPNPYTATNILPVTWVNTFDASGGGQTHYQIKAFDETTHGAGFPSLDEDTDTAFYDSGETPSTSQTAVTDVLENGETYRVAVRVAQTVNGVLFWSAWSTTDVTINVATSDVASVAVAPDDADGHITVTVTRAGASEAWELVEVQRSIDAGVTWLPVRFATIIDPGDPNTFAVDDHEVGNGVPATYRARAARYLNDLAVVGPWTTSSSTSWSSNTLWLKAPNNPTLNVAITDLRTAVRLNRPIRRQVYSLLGDGEDIAISDGMKAPRGDIVIKAADWDEVDEIVSLFRASPTALLSLTPELARVPLRYIAPSNVVEVPSGDRVVTDITWLNLVDAGSVAAPSDSTAGAY